MTNQASTDPVNVAKAMLQMAGALDSRTPRPDPFTLTAWSNAVQKSTIRDVTVSEAVDAVTAWSLIPELPAVRPGTILEHVRLARARRRPPTIAEQEAAELERIAKANAIVPAEKRVELTVGSMVADCAMRTRQQLDRIGNRL